MLFQMDLRDSDFFVGFEDNFSDVMYRRELVIQDDGSVVMTKLWYYPPKQAKVTINIKVIQI
jgi:hypothetical protein